MKKNGFTLIELLSVIALLGMLVGIATPGVLRIKNNMEKKSWNTKKKQMEQAAVLWGQNNKGLINNPTYCSGIGESYDSGSCTTISISRLLSEDYFAPDKLPSTVYGPVSNTSKDYKGTNIASGTNYCIYVYKHNNRVYAKYRGSGSNCKY